MSKRKKRKNKPKHDLIPVKLPEIKSSCSYGCVFSQNGRRITLLLCNQIGYSFRITYYDTDCHDSRDGKRMTYNTTCRELQRLLGDSLGTAKHKEALFRLAVIN